MKKEAVLTIPREYLVENNKVKTEDGLVELTLGLQNLEIVEVISGIDEDTYILNPD